MTDEINRRTFVKGSVLASAGAALGLASGTTANAGEPARSPAAAPPAPQTGLPKGKIGKLEISRILLGGNLLTHYTHSRELQYVYNLAAHYNTEKKIIETLAIAEQNGINTTLMRADPHIMEHYQKFTRERNGKLHWIAQSAPEQGDPVENAKRARDHGAIAMYHHGGVSDHLVKEGKVAEIGRALEGMRNAGLMAGIGAHLIPTIQACVQAKIEPDFYMVTVNQAGYYTSPAAEVEQFMSTIKQPWIGFKTLGAGRVNPPGGFHHAFQRGADFIAVGMFDWQVRDDAAHVQEMLAKGIARDRAWA